MFPSRTTWCFGRTDGESSEGRKSNGHRTQDTELTWSTQGREGVVLVKTTQAILVTHYPETVQPGSAANTVEQLGDYLIKVGY